jgi:hypothetical protein
MSRSPAMKAYNQRMIWLSLGYAVFLIAAVYGFKHDLLQGKIAYVVAILPALPIIGIFAAMGRYLVEETDEFVRMLMVRQTLWASGFTLSLATIWGFLESFDLAGHVDGYWVAITWFFGLGIGGMVNKLQFGSSGSGC